MKKVKTIALVAHDNRKTELAEWVEWNHLLLLKHHLVSTGTTGRLVEETLAKIQTKEPSSRAALKPDMTLLKSGPLGGDQQLGAMIAEERIDMIIFFWDPMEPQPHDVDVKALLRIAVLYNIPTACNRATADFLISSPLMLEAYQAKSADFSAYLSRTVPQNLPHSPDMSQENKS